MFLKENVPGILRKGLWSTGDPEELLQELKAEGNHMMGTAAVASAEDS